MESQNFYVVKIWINKFVNGLNGLNVVQTVWTVVRLRNITFPAGNGEEMADKVKLQNETTIEI